MALATGGFAALDPRLFQTTPTGSGLPGVDHVQMALLTRHSVHVVELTKTGKATDRVVKCDLIHVVALEPVNGRNGRGTARRQRRPR